MSKEIRVYDYVNKNYERVRDSLQEDAPAVFRAATKAAEGRAQTVASELRVDLGGVSIGTDIVISVKNVEETPSAPGSGPATCLQLEWEAATMPGLFPQMKAELRLYPLTATETQLDFAGTYDPPMGPLGGLLDAVAGRRVAEASVHRFVSAVAEHLRRTLA